MTKPHRPRTYEYRDAGRERASGAASRTRVYTDYASSRSKHLKATLAMDSDGVAGRKEEVQEEYDLGADHADVGRADL